MASAVRQPFGRTHRGNALIKIAVIKPAIALPALLQRFWWHTKAYGLSAGLLLLLAGKSGCAAVALLLPGWIQTIT